MTLLLFIEGFIAYLTAIIPDLYMTCLLLFIKGLGEMIQRKGCTKDKESLSFISESQSIKK